MTTKSAEIENNGSFKRQSNRFVTPFGDQDGELPVEANRYRLLWAPVCPWAHRAMIARKLLGLEEAISVGTADPLRPRIDRVDWAFTWDDNDVDPVLGVHYISEVYLNADPEYAGRPTVPAIVDIASKQVVNNDYHELTYYLETVWKPFHKEGAPDLFPEALQRDIRELNERIFHGINNGVYKAGFARSQEAYEQAYDGVFELLDELEARLDSQRYLFGNRITDADIRLYVTLARFDIAYYTPLESIAICSLNFRIYGLMPEICIKLRDLEIPRILQRSRSTIIYLSLMIQTIPFPDCCPRARICPGGLRTTAEQKGSNKISKSIDLEGKP